MKSGLEADPTFRFSAVGRVPWARSSSEQSAQPWQHGQEYWVSEQLDLTKYSHQLLEYPHGENQRKLILDYIRNWHEAVASHPGSDFETGSVLLLANGDPVAFITELHYPYPKIYAVARDAQLLATHSQTMIESLDFLHTSD